MQSTPSCRPLRILVADDNRDAADSLRMLLEIWGHEVRTAYDGQEALDVAASFRPHVALLDLRMPHVHGGEVARRLREQPGAALLLLVATTAHCKDDSRVEPYRDVFDCHLCKPVNLTELEQLLASVPSPSPGPGDGHRSPGT
jgi:two-component system CheB/CheR fusion protein